MKRNIFATKLARSAAASAIFGSAVIPAHQATAAVLPPRAAQEFTFPETPILPEQEQQISSEGNFVITMPESPSAWDKKLEREFRSLAMAEANSTISRENAYRLEQLGHWRDQLLNPQTADEILRQIKRDSLLVRMENLLKEYVEFKEASGQAGVSA
jgi:hypothetical protein